MCINTPQCQILWPIINNPKLITVSVNLKSGLSDILDVDVRVEHLRWLIRDLATTRSIETNISIIELQVHVCVCVGKRGQKKMMIGIVELRVHEVL